MEAPIVIKLGGTSATDSNVVLELARELISLSTNGVIIHGGGKEVSKIGAELGYTPVFENGIRITGDEEMDVVEMVLAGVANKRLVRALCAGGVDAVGISGSDGAMITGTPITTATGLPSRTGTVQNVRTNLLESLWEAGWLPVVAPTSAGTDGTSLNINADDVAFALAAALGAGTLIFLSDVPGVLDGGKVIQRVDGSTAEEAIASGTISGGMIPKVRNAVTALGNGVASVVIGCYRKAGDVTKMVAGEAGTSIVSIDQGGGTQ